MKKLSNYLLILALLIGSFAVHAQEDLSFLPPGLHKLTLEEFQKTPLVISKLPHYLEGKELNKSELLSYHTNTSYRAELYGDKNGKAKAVVFRKATAAEKEARESMMPKSNMNATDWQGKEPPRFVVNTLADKEVDLATLKGKIVVVNFWFVGCKPCIQEMPELNELTEAFKGKEVEFLAFALDSEDRLERFLEEKEFLYEVVPDARATAREYKISGYPSHMIIDQEGTVAFFQRGYRVGTGKILEREISKLLE